MRKPSAQVLVALAALGASCLLLASMLKTGRSEAAQGDQKAPAPQERAANVQYASARLKLAQLNLQSAVATNANAPGAIPEAQMGALREIIAIAEAESQEASSGEPANWRRVQIAAAQVSLETARAGLQRAEALNASSPGSVSNSKMEVLQLKAEIARLALERARAATGASPLDDLEWQLYDLRQRILLRGTQFE